MTHAEIFAGISGFGLAADAIGWKTLFQVDSMAFARSILRKNYKDIKKYGKVEYFQEKEIEEYRGSVDVVSAGFPCQPFSNAGNQRGEQDPRFEWHHLLRILQGIKPRFFVGENVAGLVEMEGGRIFESICSDLENEGFEVQSFLIPAYAVGRNHIRRRIWIIAYPKCAGQKGWIKQNKQELLEGTPAWNKVCKAHEDQDKFISKPELLRGYDGFPARLDKDRIEVLGNSIVPYIAYELFAAIDTYDKVIKGIL